MIFMQYWHAVWAYWLGFVSLSKKKIVGIYSWNRVEWVLAIYVSTYNTSGYKVVVWIQLSLSRKAFLITYQNRVSET